MRRPNLLLAAFALVLAAFFHAGPIAAQDSITPSAEQLDLLRNLSPDQRDALLQQLTGSGGSSGSSDGSSLNERYSFGPPFSSRWK